MGSQQTASKTDLLLECQRPFSPDLEVPRQEPTEPMTYGSCIHALVDARLKDTATTESEAATCEKWGVKDVEGARVHADAAIAKLRDWCSGNNPYKMAFRVLLSEIPMATAIVGKPPRTRIAGFEEETHTYDLRPGEIAGTYDILLASIELRELHVVVDLKTGSYGDWTAPEKLGQMKTLVMQSRVVNKWRAKQWTAAILHCQKDLPAVMYVSEPITEADSRKHLNRLRRATERVGDGSLRPGNWCFRCPAREGCPANDGALLARSGALVKMGTQELMKEAVDAGALHMFLQQFRILDKRATQALRAEIERGALVMRPDGKTLVLREVTVERGLSKKGILEGLGAERGEALLQLLREKGILHEETETRMVAVDDK